MTVRQAEPELMNPPSRTVSVTRFHIRSVRFMPLFMLHANRAIGQLRKADGFLTGALQRDDDQAFLTLTVWRDEQAMRVFGASGAHRKASPHLAEWADEASVACWTQSGDDLPDWPQAVRRLREEGRVASVRYPGP